MAKLTLVNQKIFLGEYEVTSVSNALSLDYSAEAVDCTTFGDDTRVRTGGLKDVTLTVEGYVDTALDVDAAMFNNVGGSDIPVGVLTGTTVGDVGYFFNSHRGSFTPGAAIGELYAFSVESMARGGDGLIRGTLMVNAADATVSSSANSTAQQLGAVSATQTLHSGLFVSEANTGTLDVVITSDTSSGGAFATTQITHTQVTTTATSEMLTKVGPVTDTYYRVEYTIAASGTYKFVVLLGII